MRGRADRCAPSPACCSVYAGSAEMQDHRAGWHLPADGEVAVGDRKPPARKQPRRLFARGAGGFGHLDLTPDLAPWIALRLDVDIRRAPDQCLQELGIRADRAVRVG